ncbi:hypothetical protein MAH1_31980 [Sessilibacter sp. MAH1]
MRIFDETYEALNFSRKTNDPLNSEPHSGESKVKNVFLPDVLAARYRFEIQTTITNIDESTTLKYRLINQKKSNTI